MRVALAILIAITATLANAFPLMVAPRSGIGIVGPRLPLRYSLHCSFLVPPGNLLIANDGPGPAPAGTAVHWVSMHPSHSGTLTLASGLAAHGSAIVPGAYPWAVPNTGCYVGN